MKRILLVINILFASQSFAAAPTNTFCSSGDLNFTGANNCISTCSALSASAERLSSGASGFCRGQSSLQKFTLYKIALGRESSGNEPLCTIWNGETVVTTSSNEAGSSNNSGIIDLSSCPSGTYDVVHITSSRFQDYAGDTIFPDGSGDVVRTTSAFANDSADYTTVADWRETSTSHSDDSKGYVRPASSWSNVFNKLASAPSATNLTNSTNVTMRYDWLKAMKAGDSVERSGWLCDGESFCERAVGSDKRESRIRHTETTIVEGLPLTIKDGDVTLDSLDIGYYSTSSASRSGTEELGMRVLWYNDGGTLKYLGTKPHDDGSYIKFGIPHSWN